ncbi:MAG: spermidine/putrescine transport system ATP-binding protein [Paracoccaceae bacterium]|jgi:spermidine/putrescine transport system ATP-binding protein
MTKDVTLDNVSVEFGDFTAVDRADLNIEGGEFFSFLGPSGCGKTTLLRCISGFQDPTGGQVRIGGQNMRGIRPNKRPTALIFQNLALFPLMTVAENIAFPLEVRGIDKKTRRHKADELLELIALTGQGDKKISELSGGQMQRVAIARALAVEPDILLLDEPLSALDLKLRQHMRRELRAIQKQVGLTFIYITHDQGEALTMSDRVAVMSHGRIEQVGDSRAVYDRPRTSFVASFVGENNALPARVLSRTGDALMVDAGLGAPMLVSAPEGGGLAVGAECYVFVRPEALHPADADDRNAFSATPTREEFEGNLRHIVLNAGGQDIRMTLVNDHRSDWASTSGMIAFSPDMAIALPRGELASA